MRRSSGGGPRWTRATSPRSGSSSRPWRLLSEPLTVGARGGASDASHLAGMIELTVDGLGPRGGHAHHPDEFVAVDSVRPRAEIALAVAIAALGAA